MCESAAVFGRDFCKRRWESAFFADFHGRGILHQAICHVVLPTDFTEDPKNCYISWAADGRQELVRALQLLSSAPARGEVEESIECCFGKLQKSTEPRTRALEVRRRVQDRDHSRFKDLSNIFRTRRWDRPGLWGICIGGDATQSLFLCYRKDQESGCGP